MIYTNADNNTEIDSIASLKASKPLATSELELTSFPLFLTYKPNTNLTIIPAINTIKVTRV